MRWPLRRQILLPMVGILLATIVVVSALNAWLARRREASRLNAELARIVETMAATNVPLTASVLQQTRGLTGAEFVAIEPGGQPAAASDEAFSAAATTSSPPMSRIDFASPVSVGQGRYLHGAATLDRRQASGGRFVLHVFYPEAAWQEASWQAVWPPLAIGGVAALLVAAAALALAAHLTQPIEQLRAQVGLIAAGQFATLPLPDRDDEIRALAADVNRMAEQLAKYEKGTRESERLRTLGTLGGGIAHQIRNAATGCRIALDLHQRDCPLATIGGQGDEPLDVAVRQLGLIETHIQRFLTLGRPSAAAKLPVELTSVVDQAIELARPSAAHLGVALEFHPPAEPLIAVADAAALTQLVVNLLVNGVEAAARTRLSAATSVTAPAGSTVTVLLSPTEGQAELVVCDPGAGPSTHVQPRLFEPFATDKPGGTGLGLAVVRQIAEDHGGRASWERRDGQTCFRVELPLAERSPREAEPAGETLAAARSA